MRSITGIFSVLTLVLFGSVAFADLVDLDGKAAVDVCSRTEGIRVVLEREISKTCDQISDRDLATVKSLRIYRRLSEVSRRDFSGLQNLEVLDLANNFIKTIEPGVFQDLWHLKRLDLSHNLLPVLSSGMLLGLVDLEEFYIGDNKIETVEQGVFGIAPQLRILFLSNNSIGSFKAELVRGLSHMERLFLSGNQLESLESEIFANIPNLQWLYLDANGFADVPAGMGVLTKLSVLALGHNRIDSVSEEAFAGLESLESILLDGNLLQSLEAKPFLKIASLRYLNLEQNPLSKVSIDQLKDTLPSSVTVILPK